MDTTVRHAAAITVIALGCGFSVTSHAYSKEDDAQAQDREVQAAYDRGYKAAREEMAQASATHAPAAAAGSTSGNASTNASAAAPKKAAGAPKPILDFKHTYSDAGDASDVTTVMTVPVVVKPLAEGGDAQAAPVAAAQA